MLSHRRNQKQNVLLLSSGFDHWYSALCFSSIQAQIFLRFELLGLSPAALDGGLLNQVCLGAVVGSFERVHAANKGNVTDARLYNIRLSFLFLLFVYDSSRRTFPPTYSCRICHDMLWSSHCLWLISWKTLKKGHFIFFVLVSCTAIVSWINCQSPFQLARIVCIIWLSVYTGRV